MPMHKCIFCKKHSIKGYYRCEITGQISKKLCTGYTPTEIKFGNKNKCKNFQASLFNRFLEWADRL